MVRPEELKYDERGLVPCIVQDAATGEVLMLAWQTRDALERTLRTGSATFFSRSRGEIWVKGATSGNTQALRGARAD
jgi:phosphoribosyl-AMP cyclohydrolase